MSPEFLKQLSNFTVQFGIDHLNAGGTLHQLANTTLFNAFKDQHQIDPRTQVHHYFSRPEWEAAVIARDATKFRAKRIKTPVQAAATIEANLELCPDL